MMVLVFMLAVLLLQQSQDSLATCSPNDTPDHNVRVGESTYVCITLNNQYRSLFIPTVDTFTELYLKSSYVDSRISESDAYITVSSMNSISFQKLYRAKNGKTFPSLTAIISVKQGQIQGITWDDGCSLCENGSCEANTYSEPGKLLKRENFGTGDSCFTSAADCLKDPSSCDLVVYVGWTGTDKNGKYLSSAGLRFSRFQAYSIQSYVKEFRDRIASLV